MTDGEAKTRPATLGRFGRLSSRNSASARPQTSSSRLSTRVCTLHTTLDDTMGHSFTSQTAYSDLPSCDPSARSRPGLASRLLEPQPGLHRLTAAGGCSRWFSCSLTSILSCRDCSSRHTGVTPYPLPDRGKLDTRLVRIPGDGGLSFAMMLDPRVEAHNLLQSLALSDFDLATIEARSSRSGVADLRTSCFPHADT